MLALVDTIDYIQGIGNRSINPLHLCPNHSAFSMKAVCFTLTLVTARNETSLL